MSRLHLNAGRVAGVIYLAASMAFVLVFSWLAEAFAYPSVLDQPASEVLPALYALGNDGRAVWAAYALLPLTLVPAVIGAAASLRDRLVTGTGALGLAVALQVIAAVAMTIGLARWSTLQWSLAEAYVILGPESQGTIAAVSNAANSFFGNAIGEFVGELTLYGSFAALLPAIHASGGRRTTWLGVITVTAGWLGMFRNVSPSVSAAAASSNVLLPLFLITFGVWLVRTPRVAHPGTHRLSLRKATDPNDAWPLAFAPPSE